MNSDLVDLAFREVSETKRLLEALLASSESFDYVRAKATLDELRQKIRVLGRVQAELAAQHETALDRIVPFPGATRIGF
jgi:hypothetical protein